MAQDTKPSVPDRRPRRWPRILGIIFALFFVLLIVAWFVGTSGWFLKSVILPKASAALNAKVTVADASISPFSSVTLRDLKVETKGPEPLVTAKEVRARYSLMQIIKGNIKVDEVLLESPVITLITFPDGSTNLDPITKQEKPKEKEKPKAEKKDGEPPKIDLQKFALNNATVRKIDQRKDGTRQLLELTGVTVTADQLGNNKTAKLGLAANVYMDQGLSSASNGVLRAKVGGNFDVALDAALKPKTAKGQTRVDVTEGKGAFQQANGFGTLVNADLTPTQLNDVSIRFSQGNNALGALTVSGPFNAETMEGKLAIVLSGIDRRLLSIAGGAAGIDFNQTAISSTNTVELTQRGRIVSVNGQLLVGSMSLTQKGQTSPVLDIRSAYGVTYDQTNKTALIQNFTLNGTQQGNEFLRAGLSKPMMLNLGSASNAVDESALTLVVTNFNLPDWQAFAGTNATLSSGRLGVNLDLVSREAGKSLALNLATRLTQLSVTAGSNRIQNADLALDARGTVRNFAAVNLEQYRATLAQGGQQALLASGALQYNTASQDADVQANLETALPVVTKLVSVPGIELSGGTVKFAGRVVQKNTTPNQTNNPVLDRTVVGKLNVDELIGAVQSNRFDRFAAAIDLDIAMNGPALNIKKFAGALQQSGQPGGTFDVSGTYNTDGKAGQIAAKLVDLNQNVLKSFLAAALGEKQLETITVNATTTAKLDGPESMAVKAEFHVANLVVNDPTGAVPRSPLAVDLGADIGMAKQVLDLRQVQLALTKTERAPNSVNVSGRVDMSKSNAYTGFVNVTSEGLDVTPYYDLFAKKGTNVAAKPAETASAPQPPAETKPEVEPEPMQLPVSLFTNEIKIAKFFLREIAISNLVSKTVIDNGKIAVNPFSLTLNGAPITLQVAADVSVPGYRYDVATKFDNVPIEPLANTFAPERKGQVKGDLLLNAQINGAGTTGKSLQKNLAANAGFTLTNANIQVTQNKRIQQILLPLSVALRIPQLAESPITWMDGRTVVSNGTIVVQGVGFESSVLRGNLSGTATMAEVLTNSTLNKLPIEIALRRNVADAARLTPPDTSAETQFVPLPRFASVGGTLGDPKPDIDKIAVGRILAGAIGGMVGGDAGKILRGIGSIGGGSSTNASGTNAPATNTVGGLLQGIGGLLNKPSTDSNAATTNAPPRRRGILDGILK